MRTTFASQVIWPQLTKAARDSRQRCAVDVAYFGAGASRLLPLPKGGRLAVDLVTAKLDVRPAVRHLPAEPVAPEPGAEQAEA